MKFASNETSLYLVVLTTHDKAQFERVRTPLPQIKKNVKEEGRGPSKGGPIRKLYTKYERPTPA
jgi:hypothetical protein